MTKAAYSDLMDDRDLTDALDSFVRHVMATTDLIWAASDHDAISTDTIGVVAYNLSSEASYMLKRLDKRHAERMEEIYQERPELREEEAEISPDDEVIGPEILKSARAKKHILTMMDEYEMTHTAEETVRMGEAVIAEIEASREH